jgi:hypothetical protein
MQHLAAQTLCLAFGITHIHRACDLAKECYITFHKLVYAYSVLIYFYDLLVGTANFGAKAIKKDFRDQGPSQTWR